MIQNIYINIDSKFRNKNIYNNSGKFSINFGDKLKNIKYIKLVTLELPNLFYTITSIRNNNYFNIKIYDNNLTNVDIVLDDGFYNSTQLLHTIQNKFNLINPNNNSNNNPIITLDVNTGKTIITCSLQFDLNFSNTGKYESLGTLLGFTNNQYININNIKSESIFNNNIDNYIFLKINNYGNIYNNVISNINPTTFLAKIILPTNKTEITFVKGKYITKKYVFKQPIDINKLDIELIDSYDNIIDMINLNYSFTLKCGQLI